MKILAFDTATEALSVALYVDGEISLRQSRPLRGHGEWLLPMIDEVLAQGGLGLTALDALAVGRGPGAFTGVRIAISVAQGLAFAANLPIVPVSDLSALALAAARRASADGLASPFAVLSCLDARLGGLYAAYFELPATAGVAVDERRFLAPQEALCSAESAEIGAALPLVVAGHGWLAGSVLPARVGSRLAACYPDLLPDAGSIARLAACLIPAGAGLAPEDLAPVYLRDEVATASTRRPGAPR